MLTFNLQNAKTWNNTSYKHQEHRHNNSAKESHNINVKKKHERYINAKERHDINTKKEHECNISAKEWFNNNAKKKNTNTKTMSRKGIIKM